MLLSIVGRLIAHCADFKAVEVAEDVDALIARAGLVESPSVIVMPYRERATPSPLAAGGFRQRVAMQFLTGIVVRQYDDVMGADRAATFDSLKDEVEAALAGWEPEGAIESCELVGGESSPISTGVSIYVQTWETARFLTGASQ